MAAAVAVPPARFFQLEVGVALHHLALGVARAARSRGSRGRDVPLARVDGAFAGAGPRAVAVADAAAELGAAVLDVEVGVAFKPEQAKGE